MVVLAWLVLGLGSRVTHSLAGQDPRGADTAATVIPAPAAHEASGAKRDTTTVRTVGSTEGHPIASVTVTPLNIYEPVPSGRFRSLYRLANRLHVRTRKQTIRNQLLFETGDRWSDASGEETERNLRVLDFVTPTRIEARRAGDSVHVAVVTNDLWTTSPEINFQGVEGKQYGSISLVERNLFGLGKSFAVSYREDPIGASRSVSYDDPNLFDSRAQFHFIASKGSETSTDQWKVELPFYAQDTPLSYGIEWNRASSIHRLYEASREVARFDRRFYQAEIWWGRGIRRGPTIWRFVGSLLDLDRQLGPTSAEPGAPVEFLGAKERLRLHRLAAEARWWRPHFIERTHVNRMGMIEDFDLGPSATIKLGFAPEFIGSTADEGYASLRLDGGLETGFGFGWVRSNVSSRLRRAPREILRQADVRWVSRLQDRHTFVVAVRGVAGKRMERDFQLAVGGLNGLRAYPPQTVAGTQVLRVNAEERLKILESYGQLFTLGAVVFGDAARAWGPGSGGGDWFFDAGAGVRIAMPQWSLRQVLRADVAWPIQPSRSGRREPVLSFGSSQAF